MFISPTTPSALPGRQAAIYNRYTAAIPARPAKATWAAPNVEPPLLEMGLGVEEAAPVGAPVNEVALETAVGWYMVVELTA